MTRPLHSAALAAALSSAALPAVSGGFDEPMRMEPAVIVEETAAASSAADVIVPLILIALIAAAIANQSDGASAVVGGGGGGGTAVSDARLKTDITPVGVSAEGLTLYQFRYLGSSDVWEGVLAQEVLTHRPDAVHPFIGDTLAVDYGALGLEMRRVR